MCSSNIADFVVELEMVHSILSSIDPNSIMGQYSPEITMKYFRTIFCSLFWVNAIYNTSLQEELLPHQLLYSIIVLILKKISRYNLINYRPVSIIPVPCKVLERLLVVHLNEYSDMNRIISDEQFGFHAALSTKTSFY